MFPAWPTICQREHAFIFFTPLPFLSGEKEKKTNHATDFGLRTLLTTRQSGKAVICWLYLSNPGQVLGSCQSLSSPQVPLPLLTPLGTPASDHLTEEDQRRHCHNTLCKYLPWIDWKVFSCFLLEGMECASSQQHIIFKLQCRWQLPAFYFKSDTKKDPKSGSGKEKLTVIRTHKYIVYPPSH